MLLKGIPFVDACSKYVNKNETINLIASPFEN